MVSFDTIGKYKISSVKSLSDNFSVYIGFTGEIPYEKKFIINEFKYNEKNKRIFKELFLYFESDEKIEYFKDFFSLNGHFYATFDYFDDQNIVYKYNKQTCTSSFNERIKIFESVCIKISSYLSKKAPELIMNCIVSPENIVVSDKYDVFFNFDMKKIYPNVDYNIYANKKDIVKKTYNIFKVFFDVEMSSKYNHVIRFISQKCELGIYKLVPEIVIDLKNRYGEASISSFTQFWKYQFKIRKNKISKSINILLVTLMVILLSKIIFDKVKTNFITNTKSNNLSIGDLSYSAGSDMTSDNTLSAGGTSVETSIPPKNVPTIPKGADVDYEDYIIKNNDTVNSISEQYYGDKSFSPVITSFNEISGCLIPGTIIKVPSKSAVCS